MMRSPVSISVRCRISTVQGASNPNISKDLTDGEKAELGGAGSSTPGGWEPQDEENARNSSASTAPSKDRLNEAASASNRNGLTDAGRALQKHGGREGSAYSYSSQKASVLNQEAQSIVKEILNNPNTKIESRVVLKINKGLLLLKLQLLMDEHYDLMLMVQD